MVQAQVLVHNIHREMKLVSPTLETLAFMPHDQVHGHMPRPNRSRIQERSQGRAC